MTPFLVLTLLLVHFKLLPVLCNPVYLRENTDIEFAYTVGNNNFYYVFADGSEQIYTFNQFAISITISTYIPVASPTPWHVTIRKGHPAWPSSTSFNVESVLKNIGMNLKNQGWGGIFYKYGDGCPVHCDWSSISKSHTIRIQTPTLHPTRSPTAFTASPTALPTVSPTLRPTAPTHPTPLPTHTPSATPSRTPTRYPTAFPTQSPTPVPTPQPTARPTFKPTVPPSSSPSQRPTASPSISPSKHPSVSPSKHPTVSPSLSPSHSPTQFPSISPSTHPTWNPSMHPTAFPSLPPTSFPTLSPSRSPTLSPTDNPSHSPTRYPTHSPTAFPTVSPSRSPTLNPTRSPSTTPTRSPTQPPSVPPTASPTLHPSLSPTHSPSHSPSKSPTRNPTTSPTRNPTHNPTVYPTVSPSRSPTISPTRNPTKSPTKAPTQPPSISPTRYPTTTPTRDPTPNPTRSPTKFPSVSPSMAPSAAPTYYVNPYCPQAQALERMGPQTNNLALTEYAECRVNDPAMPGSRAIDFQGKLSCQADFSCCLCQQIYCGASGYGCSRLIMGVSAGIGVPNIYIQSWSSIAQMAATKNPYATVNGAAFYCDAPESCKNTDIEAGYISHGYCNGEFGCQNSRISMQPAEKMIFKCDGRFSCAGAYIDIYIAPNSPVANIEALTFLGEQSANGAVVNIRNMSPHALLIKNFECSPTSCMNTVWRFEGLIFLQSCDLKGLQNLYALPLVMQSCILGTPFNPQPI